MSEGSWLDCFHLLYSRAWVKALHIKAREMKAQGDRCSMTALPPLCRVQWPLGTSIHLKCPYLFKKTQSRSGVARDTAFWLPACLPSATVTVMTKDVALSRISWGETSVCLDIFFPWLIPHSKKQKRCRRKFLRSSVMTRSLHWSWIGGGGGEWINFCLTF